MVLDSANRTTARNALGFKYCLVQVVKYEDPPVTLTTRHHVITGLGLDDLPFVETELEPPYSVLIHNNIKTIHL